MIEAKVPEAEDVTVTEDTLRVELYDGRTISVPLAWYPRLVHAAQEERDAWELIGEGQGIRWAALDEDLSVEGLIAGRPSGESQRSLKQLTGREACRAQGDAVRTHQRHATRIGGVTAAHRASFDPGIHGTDWDRHEVRQRGGQRRAVPLTLSGKHAPVEKAGTAIPPILERSHIAFLASRALPSRRCGPAYKRASRPKHHDALHWAEVRRSGEHRSDDLRAFFDKALRGVIG